MLHAVKFGSTLPYYLPELSLFVLERLALTQNLPDICDTKSRRNGVVCPPFPSFFCLDKIFIPH